jgi:hypothetical protein
MHLSNTGAIVRVMDAGKATFGLFAMRPDPKNATEFHYPSIKPKKAFDYQSVT